MLKLVPFFLLALFMGCQTNTPTAERTDSAPAAEKVIHTFTEHGNEREDPYHWLSDKTDPTVLAHLEKENEHTTDMLAHTKGLQDDLYNELVARIEQKYESLPSKRNGYWYYVRYEEGNEYPFYCRKKGNLAAPEEIILNVNEMSKGHEIYRLFQYFVSPDNEKIAFLVDTSGDRRNTLYFKNLKTGEILADQLSNCSYGGAWANDNQHFFYTLNDKTVRSYRVMRHALGQATTSDTQLYIEPDSTFSAGVNRSQDGRYIFMGSGSTTSAEFWFLPSDRPLSTPKVIQPRQKGLEYQVESYTGKELHIYNNHEAQNFKISTAPLSNPGIGNWKDVVPHKEGVLINSFMVKEKYLVVQERSNALDMLHVFDRTTGEESYVDFGEEVYTANMYNPTDEFKSDSIRYNYTSLTTPRSVIGYNLTTQAKKVLKQVVVGGNYDATQYETKRVWATAADGEKVPISLVYNKETFKKDGSQPCLLYSYGSYGSSSMPSFRSSVVSLLDRGFVYAIAHIRGGQEMGRGWYEDGKLLNKKNTFTDFIDCAEFLLNEKYTYKEGLFAMGGSAGGMLMGAVTNMRPDLFKGIIAYVPWMDVITDMTNPDLPLTTLEYEEWGDPNEKEYYDYMLSWSPYDNVKAADYPAILATGGVNDTQVPYFSPAKWVQKVRDNNTGEEPVLFKCNMGAGHGGASGRFERQKETALVYAFMVDQVERKVKN